MLTGTEEGDEVSAPVSQMPEEEPPGEVFNPQTEPAEYRNFHDEKIKEEPLPLAKEGAAEIGEAEFVVISKEEVERRFPSAEAPKSREHGYFVRYAIFLDRKNAAAFSKNLEEKGIKGSVFETKYPLPSFSVKAGPFVNPDSRKRAQKELKKLGVAPIPFLEQKYIVSGSVWNRSIATGVQEKLGSIGIPAELVIEKKPKRVYKVISENFMDMGSAKLCAERADAAGFKTIIELRDNERE